MYEEGLTSRKVLEFDTRLFDTYRAYESSMDWDAVGKKGNSVYLRVDGTYLIYLPTSETRTAGFANLTQGYDNTKIDYLWNVILKRPLEHIAGKLGIDDPIIVQADIAMMLPGGDTLFHTDTRYQQRYSRRYNIAISTNDECWLYYHSYDLNNGGSRNHINEGEVWELNNKIIHTAVNYGTTRRTHIIIDVMPRKYYDRMCEVCDPFGKVPNPQDKNTTYDYDIDGNLIHKSLFEDLPHCFPARTHSL
jgi:hypothetical protein